MKGTILTFLLFILLTFVLFSCSEKSEDELVISDDYMATLLMERAEKDFNLKNDPHSPFNRDPDAKYDKLKYFDPDTNYIFKSILYSYE
ncbi:MAG: hypothetical protein MUO34_15105, partial [Ignavibacteriaceae bacterium]|nr:hypothetical protein [Ignavibacteriaceae bacterium]